MVNGQTKSEGKMKIGQLSAEAGVSRDTIRFYESRGMLNDISRPFEWNNYKDYGEENVRRIRIIKYLQGFSFKLQEIKKLLDKKAASSDKCGGRSGNYKDKWQALEEELLNSRNVGSDACTAKTSVFKRKLQAIEEEIGKLKETRNALLDVINE